MAITSTTYTKAATKMATYLAGANPGLDIGNVNQDSLAALAQGLIEALLEDAIITVNGVTAGSDSANGSIG